MVFNAFIGRRAFLLGSAGLTLLGTRPLIGSVGAAEALPISIPPSDMLLFKVLRNDSEIGSHSVHFDVQGDALTVKIEAEFQVKIAFITVFRYKFHVVEQWQGGTLMSVESATDHNGTALAVKAKRDSRGLVISATNIAEYVAPPNTLCATHWNPKMLDGPIFNPEDGQLWHPKVANLGETKIALASGTEVTARHFELTGDLPQLDLWYDPNQIWTGLKAKGTDGSDILYQRA